MLIYESDSCLEVEGDAIVELYRSGKPIKLTVSDEKSLNLHAILCLHRQGSETLAHAAFYCRDLKRALNFAVQTVSGKEMPQGLAVLSDLGFRMEPVKLELSSAMRQVVLRDIPGLVDPVQGRKQRTERMARLAEMEEAFQDDPEGVAGRKAKLKLDGELRLDEQMSVLREILTRKFTPESQDDDDGQMPFGRNDVLATRLASTEATLDEERGRHHQTREVLAAAEKRIQELEKILVEVETRSANGLKHKKEAFLLESRCKELTENLTAAQAIVTQEQAKVLQLSAAAKQQAAAAETRIRELVAEREKMIADQEATQATIRALTQQRDEACRQEDVLREDLAAAGNQDTKKEPDQERLDGVRKRLEALEKAQQATNAEFEQERSLRKRLEKEAATDAKRIAELEDALAEAEKAPPAPEAVADPCALDDEARSLQALLAESLTRIEAEKEIRTELEHDLGEAHKIIEALEKALKEPKRTAERSDAHKPAAGDDRQVRELTEKLKSIEVQLEQELIEQKKSAVAMAAAEKRIIELERELQGAQAAATGAAQTVAPKSPPPPKPLPHELRPGPKKGALFHPDWDLEGLPCKSADQVVQAWESVFNVQLSLEGYPSQYCTVFLVIVNSSGQKQLFMLFRLKKNNHTLVCVPNEPPTNDAAMKKAVQGAHKYLKLSGFELEELAPENVPGMLGSFFLGD
jgi:hypothetical protein